MSTERIAPVQEARKILEELPQELWKLPASSLSVKRENIGPSRNDPAYIVNARLAGRQNARMVSDEERDDYLRERLELAQKEYDGTINRDESHRLAYVRWNLDRIEDARHGYILDRLEDAVIRYEAALAEIKELRTELDAQIGKKP